MNITFFLYDGFTALDVVGVNEILCRLPNANIQFAAPWKGEVKTDSNSLKVVSTIEYDKVNSTDILIVPGSTVTFLEVIQDKKVLNWIKKMDETTQFTTAVSSGTIILAAAGLLFGKKATSHWYSLRFLAEYGVDIVEQRYVQDGKIITCAGSSAGIDMALYMAARITDKDNAQALQLMIEYEPAPPFHSGSLESASKDTMLLAKKKLKDEALRSGIFGII
jgi:transcriptional regulator GlxA family with amidase domain